MTDQIESANAALLRDLDSAAAGVQRLDRLDAESAAKAIRGLEAKVRELEADNREQREALENACNLAAHTHNTLANLLARIHRDGGHYMTQHGAEKAAEDADQIVSDLFADRDRIAAELRGTQARLSEMAGEVERWKYIAEENRGQIARLTSELAAARENEARYLWLKDNAYGWPTGACCALDQQGRAALWLLNMEDDIDASIDAARRAGEGEK